MLSSCQGECLAAEMRKCSGLYGVERHSLHKASPDGLIRDKKSPAIITGLF